LVVAGAARGAEEMTLLLRRKYEARLRRAESVATHGGCP